ncbi:MAG: ATP-binding protein [Fibrobacteria bacterium]
MTPTLNPTFSGGPQSTDSLLIKAFTQADYAVNLTDTQGSLVRVNQAYLDLYKFASDSEILGKSQRIIRSSHTPTSVYKAMWKCISSGETWRGNLTNVAKDGSEIFVHLTITPIREKGVIVGYMGFSLDRAQQVLLEKQLFHANKLVVLGTMGAGLAHELNNPLASILLDAEYLQEIFQAPGKPIDWVTAESASASLIRGVERIKKVLEHLLVYSRKEGPQRHSTLSILQLIQESFLFIERQFSNRGISIEIKADEDILISGNRTQLESIIHNLLHNSRDAFEGRTGEKRVSIHISRDSAGFAKVEYRDNAGGIPEQNLPHIFEPFFTTKGEKEGTGLGLAISKKIVAEHGGTIECESQGGTTVFNIQLPLISGEQTEILD